MNEDGATETLDVVRKYHLHPRPLSDSDEASVRPLDQLAALIRRGGRVLKSRALRIAVAAGFVFWATAFVTYPWSAASCYEWAAGRATARGVDVAVAYCENRFGDMPTSTAPWKR